MPKVSVVIPTYNRAHLICETIDSILAQTYKDYEIIVVDDGSTDNTQEVLKRYGDKVRYFYQQNQGQASAWNFAVRQSSGEYIALLDSDDLWLPQKLEWQTEVLDKNPEIGFVCSEIYAFRENGTIAHWKKEKSKKENFESMFEGNFIINPTVLMRKRCFEDVGGFDVKLRTTQDYDLWLRLTRKYKFLYMNIPLVKYRLHSQNLHKNLKQKLKDHLFIFSKEENVAHLNLFQRRIKIAREYYDFAPDFVKQKKYAYAGLCCLKAVVIYPFVGYYYRPKEIHKMRFSMPYRILKVYFMSIYYFLKALFARIHFIKGLNIYVY